MENEIENLDSQIEEVTETTETSENNESDDKLSALEEKNKKLFERAKKAEEELKKFKQPKEDTKSEPSKEGLKEGFDYAEKAFLKVNNIAPSEYSLVEKAMKSTGSTLDEVLEDEFFQAKLKSIREAKASKEATPKDSKRAGASTQDDVGYWIAKGTMPPLDKPELRRKYVDAKIEAETRGSRFTDRPVL